MGAHGGVVAASDRDVSDLLKILIHLEGAAETALKLPDMDEDPGRAAAVGTNPTLGSGSATLLGSARHGTSRHARQQDAAQGIAQPRSAPHHQSRGQLDDAAGAQQPAAGRTRDLNFAVGAQQLAKPPATSGSLLKAKQLYRTVKPKLEEWGLPVEELIRDLTQAVYAEFCRPMEELYDLLVSSIGAGKEVISNVDAAKCSMSDQVAQFTKNIPIQELTVELPIDVTKLADTVVAGLEEPKLLAPTFNTALIPKNKYTENLDVDAIIEVAMKQVYDQGTPHGAAAAGQPSPQSRNRDPVGGSSRTKKWKQLESNLHYVVEPLMEALAVLVKGLAPPMQAVTAEVFDPVEGALDSVAEMCQQTTVLKEQSCGFMNSVYGSAAGDVAAAGERSLDYGSVDVFASMEKVLAMAVQLGGMKDSVSRSITQVHGSRALFNNMFSLLQDMAGQLVAIDWNRLGTGTKGLASHYPELLRTARSILKPEGLTACIMQPSPYLTQVEAGVDDVRSSVDLNDCSSQLQGEVERLLSMLGLDLDQIQGAFAPQGSRQARAISSEQAGGSDLTKGWDATREGVDLIMKLSTLVQSKVEVYGSKEPHEIMNEMGGTLNDVLGNWMAKVKTEVAAAAKEKAEQMGSQLLNDSMTKIVLPSSLTDMALNELGTDDAAEVGKKVTNFLGSFM